MKNVYQAIYKVCDKNNSNSVLTSHLMDYITRFILSSNIMDLRILHESLDPGRTNSSISWDQFNTVMNDWTAKIIAKTNLGGVLKKVHEEKTEDKLLINLLSQEIETIKKINYTLEDLLNKQYEQHGVINNQLVTLVNEYIKMKEQLDKSKQEHEALLNKLDETITENKLYKEQIKHFEKMQKQKELDSAQVDCDLNKKLTFHKSAKVLQQLAAAAIPAVKSSKIKVKYGTINSLVKHENSSESKHSNLRLPRKDFREEFSKTFPKSQINSENKKTNIELSKSQSESSTSCAQKIKSQQFRLKKNIL